MRARWDIFFRTARTVKPIQKPPARFHFPCSIQRKSGETLRLQYITPALILQYLSQDFYLSIPFWVKRVSNKFENARRHLVRVRSCGPHPIGFRWSCRDKAWWFGACACRSLPLYLSPSAKAATGASHYPILKESPNFPNPFTLIFILSFQKSIDLSISMTFLKEFTVSTFHC